MANTDRLIEEINMARKQNMKKQKDKERQKAVKSIKKILGRLHPGDYTVELVDESKPGILGHPKLSIHVLRDFWFFRRVYVYVDCNSIDQVDTYKDHVIPKKTVLLMNEKIDAILTWILETERKKLNSA